MSHIAFGFVSGLDENKVSFGVPFSSSRLVAIGSIRDAVSDHGAEQVLVETFAERCIVPALHGNDRLKSFQCLDRSLEADGPRFDTMLGCGLSNICPHEVVG